MAFPQLIQSYPDTEGRNNNALTATFTPGDNEFIVVKVASESGNANVTSVTGLTFTSQAIADLDGSNGYTQIWTAEVVTSPGEITVTTNWTGSLSHSMVVERWGDAELDATPVIYQGFPTDGAPSISVTTEGTESILTWAIADWNAVSRTTRTYRSGAIEEFHTGTAGTDYSAFYAYQEAAVAGAQTAGMTVPGGQNPSMVALEIKTTNAGAAPVPIPVAYEGIGTASAATASATAHPLTIPDNAVEGDLLVALIATKTDTPTPSATDWSYVGSSLVSASGTAAGTGVGAQKLHVLTREVPAGGLTGTVTFTCTGANSTVGRIIRVSKDATGYTTPAWSVPLITSYVHASSTNFGGSGAGNLLLEANDVLLFASWAADDAASNHNNAASFSLTAAGVTISNVTALGTNTISTGGDSSLFVGYGDVTAGSETGVPSTTLTANTAETGGGAFIRIRATGYSSAGVTATPTGIATEEAFGTPVQTNSLTSEPTGIASEEAFGEVLATTPGQTINAVANGIPSEEAFGATEATIELSATADGIASEEAFGTLSASNAQSSLHSIGFDGATLWTTTYFDNWGSMSYANPFWTTESGWSSTGARFYFSAAWITGNYGNVTLFAQADIAPGIIDVAVGSRLRSAVATQPAQAGWVDVTWDTPISLTANTRIWIGAYSSVGRYQGAVIGGGSSDVSIQAADASGLYAGAPSGSGDDESEYQYAVTTAPWIDTPATSDLWFGVDIIAGVPGGPTTETYTPDGIASEETFGTTIATLPGVTINATADAIASEETFGTPSGPGVGSQTYYLHQNLADPTNWATDNTSYTLGTRFTSSEAGSINGIRFWLGGRQMDGKTYTGLLYNSTGALLASGTRAITASDAIGWIDIPFASPYEISAGAYYFASIHSTTPMYYTWAANLYTTAVTNGPLTVPAFASGGGGYFIEGSTPAWPVNGSTNSYYVDVDFETAAAPTNITYFPPSIDSLEAFGTTLAIEPGNYSTDGIPSAEAFGTPVGPTTAPSIMAENANTTGVADRTFWHDGANQYQMPGFARSSYYLPGQTAQFSVDYNSSFNFEVWRLGWYGGPVNVRDANARKVYGPTAGTPTNQPEAVTIPDSNGGVTCAGWSVNVSWTIPADATPGVYWLVLKGTNGTDAGHVVFIVSDKLAKKPVLVHISEATWMGAYNFYGGKTAVLTGKSLYGSSGPMQGGIENRSLCVSYDRPVVTREGISQTYFINENICLVRFLERMGIEVGYTTSEQIDADPTIMDGRTLVISSGHNEYISQRVYDKYKDVAANGTNLMNLGGNDFFWRVRHGTTDYTQTNTHGRVMWGYKDTMNGPGAHVGGDPIISAADWGGTWQDTRWSLREDTATLWGDVFIANGVRTDSLQVPFAYKSKPIWRDCPGIQALTSGQTFTFAGYTLGMEWDIPRPSEIGPPRVMLSETTVTLTNGASDANGQFYNLTTTATHYFFMAKVPNGGGYIFNASGCQFVWAVDDFHDGGGQDATVNGQQTMLNLLADLGVEIVNTAAVTAAGLTNPTPVSDISTAYGVPAQSGMTATPVGILSAEAFGNFVMGGSLTVSPPSIASAETFGSTEVSLAALYGPLAIGSEEVFGLAQMTSIVEMLVSGIASEEAFGTPTQTGETVFYPTAILTEEVFGDPAMSGTLTVSPSGIASLEAFGVPTRGGGLTVLPIGIATTETFGSPVVMTFLVASPTGIASQEAFGVAVVNPISGQTNFYLWNGTSEEPLTLEGQWNGSSVVPVDYDTIVN